MAFRRIFLFPMMLLMLAQSIAAQEAAPLFRGTDARTGESVALQDFRGKVVFLDFWASWCVPCLASLPAYEKMRNELGTSDFELIAINVDEFSEDGLSFLEEHPVSYPVLLDPLGDIGVPYRIRTLPHSFLIDRNGLIAASYRSFRKGDEIRIREDIEQLMSQDGN